MKRILIIKTSSMGDIIHTLPAVSDAVAEIENIEFDWVVEEGFAEIPSWHEKVENIIPVALRRWRKSIFNAIKSGEWSAFKTKLQHHHYDAIIDAQSLVKSAVLGWIARGTHIGYDWQSAKEPLASLLYDHKLRVSKDQHAVTRIRQLFAKALGYSMPDTAADYGLDHLKSNEQNNKPYLVFIHGTSREDKLWPEENWKKLLKLANDSGFEVKLPWGSNEERRRAERISNTGIAEVLPKMNLTEIARILANSSGSIAVDTGLAHLSAALSLPTVTLYGTTDPYKIGTIGLNQSHLTGSLQQISAEKAWNALTKTIKN